MIGRQKLRDRQFNRITNRNAQPGKHIQTVRHMRHALETGLLQPRLR